jgi:hypothetical protein
MLYGLKPYVVNKRIAVRDLQKLLSTHIKNYLPVKVKMLNDLTHEAGLVYIGGTYYSDYDQEGKRQIEVVFSYKDLEDSVKLTERRWGRVCQLFADTILHEIIHMRQYRTREFKTIPGYESIAAKTKDRRTQEYYGHKDEMGAFAFNIACELYDKFGSDFNSAIAYIDSNKAKRNKKTCYYKYLKSFDWNHSHPVIRSLKKKIVRNLPYAQVGKPFKTTDYLTY